MHKASLFVGLKSVDYFKTCLNERDELTPKKGYNVVVFDDYSSIGEKLTLVAHTDILAEAEKIAAGKKIAIGKENKYFSVFIYSSS